MVDLTVQFDSCSTDGGGVLFSFERSEPTNVLFHEKELFRNLKNDFN